MKVFKRNSITREVEGVDILRALKIVEAREKAEQQEKFKRISESLRKMLKK